MIHLLGVTDAELQSQVRITKEQALLGGPTTPQQESQGAGASVPPLAPQALAE